MTKARLEAFSDGVIAIIITIMVLELKAPDGADAGALHRVWPGLVSYVLSFIYLGIYWTNHHHMLHATDRVTGGILWANLHLLFWLSLIPFATSWLGEHPAESLPTAVYALLLLMAAAAYTILQTAIIRSQGAASRLQAAVGHDRKGKLSLAFYLAALGLAFVAPAIADLLIVLVAVMWLVPDRRIERRLAT